MTDREIKKKRDKHGKHIFTGFHLHISGTGGVKGLKKKPKQNKNQNPTKVVLYMNNLITETITTYCLIPVNSSNS
jgi:hypothetical protein